MLKITKFGAKWCKPCSQLGKVMNEILPSYDGKVAYLIVDVEEDIDLATELKIMSVPTMIFEHDGKIVCRFSGTKSGSEIKEIIEQYIK
jgi:thioredoxin 1